MEMSVMELNDLYEALADMEKELEKWRSKEHCCANCQHYYIDYGMSCCKLHDAPPEEVEDLYKEACDDWR